MASTGMPYPENAYSYDPNGDANKAYYPPPDAYTYYPTINSMPLPEGAVYYPVPQSEPQDTSNAGAFGNLPPADVARLIPCRYFPACRYGTSCMFAHPQGPYFPGPIPPPAQYAAPYDPMTPQPYNPNYYSVPPPSFQPPNGVHPMTSLPSPPLSMPNGRSPSEMMANVPPQFSPNSAPPPVPYGPISPMMSPMYPHQGQVPIPMSIPPLPPLHHQPPPPPPSGPQSPHSMYQGLPAPAPQFSPPADGVAAYHLPPVPAHYPHANGVAPNSPPLNPQPDFGSGPAARDNGSQPRRGTVRRVSMIGRKPPCLFFPAGRCKNGCVLCGSYFFCISHDIPPLATIVVIRTYYLAQRPYIKGISRPEEVDHDLGAKETAL